MDVHRKCPQMSINMSMDIHLSMDIRRYPWMSVANVHTCPLMSMDIHHGHPSVDIHGCPSQMFTNVQEYP